jgi:prepilin-type N-terminal cleavage/methylation domain-containing protein
VLSRQHPIGALRRENGFTLTEMITTMAILGIVIAAFATILSSTTRHSTQEQEMGAIQAEARASVEEFSRDLRQAYTGVAGSWPIEAISSTSIRFQSPQRLTPFKLQRIEWQLNGTSLQRRFVTTSDTDGDPWVWPTSITSAAWSTRTRSVRNTSTAVFRGFKADGTTATTVPSEVRVVQITLQLATTGQPGRTYTLTTRVTPRLTPGT